MRAVKTIIIAFISAAWMYGLASEAQTAKSLLLFPLPSFDYHYGTWEQAGAVVIREGELEVMPPATDVGGAGKEFSPGLSANNRAIIRVTAKIGERNEATGFNIVLKDQDVGGVEDHVYFVDLSRLSREQFQTVDIPLAVSSLVNNRVNNRPDMERGELVAWEIQGNHQHAAPIHVLVRRVEIILP